MEEKNKLRPIELKPVRPAVETPHADESFTSALVQNYNSGRWNSIIELCEGGIAEFVNSFPSPMFDGSSVAKLYFAAQAFNAIGERDKYIACLKILYSLLPYGNAIGGKYREMLDAGVKDYLNLAANAGINYLNEFEVTGIFEKKSGCFIATAAYGSPLADQVIVLKRFRNHFLLVNRFGRFFVKTYYLFSPYLANKIERNPFAKSIAKCCLKPIISIAKVINNSSL